ncbi:MAG: UDP-N-acetylglucosamine 4,6-dehydratase (inverting) [Desulfovibrionaceae bacterium]|nr:UDP-N-acetylglucosamine 4,6-dehydratase (inverting) [Desulfovibrionaceae bacterium]MBF0512663.1 UDP-N-acetylglucosamine 4,6-dehydratase (inverting) [Desulfovibrionaceae bacterium]
MIDGKVILITGGTGSFGGKCVETLLLRHKPKKVIVFSRDELKQFDMARRFPESQYPAVRYFIGDVRDKDRLRRAFAGVDVIIHAAALKQVPTAEYNPYEAIKTNIIGATNIIDAAIDLGVKKVIALSTDKAVNPLNLYGATKLCSDKLFIAANAYVGSGETKFSVVRYGNVIGSRGSVVSIFRELRPSGVIPVTHPEMTRFWITVQQGVDFVLSSIGRMVGAETFIPKIPSMNILDLAKAVAPDCRVEIVGVRPGEKLHEIMIPRDEAPNTVEFPDFYLIKPAFRFFARDFALAGSVPVPEGFEYCSNTNAWKLGIDELKSMLAS